MNETTTFSTKMDLEIKEKLQAMIEESGAKQKDFMAMLVNNYEANRARESMGQQAKELEQLRHHLARIEEIYINIVKTAQDHQEADAGQIVRLETDLCQAKAEVVDTLKINQNILRESKEQIEAAQAEVREQVEAALAEVALNKIATEKEIEDMRQKLDKAQKAQEQAVRLANLAENAAKDAENRATAVEALAGKAEQYQQEAKQALLTLEEKEKQLAEAVAEGERFKIQSQEQIQKLIEKTNLEKDRAVLNSERKSMDEISRLREALATAREELAQSRGEIMKLELGKRK